MSCVQPLEYGCPLRSLYCACMCVKLYSCFGSISMVLVVASCCICFQVLLVWVWFCGSVRMKSASVLFLMLRSILCRMFCMICFSKGGLMTALMLAQVGSFSESWIPPQKMSCLRAVYHVCISGWWFMAPANSSDVILK